MIEAAHRPTTCFSGRFLKMACWILFFLSTSFGIGAADTKVSVGSHATAAPTPISYTDPRFRNWAFLFQSRRFDQLLKSVQEDLLTQNPHPLASLVWVSAQDRLQRLSQAMRGPLDPKIRSRVGELPEIYQYYKDRKFGLMLREFPNAQKISNPWSFIFLYLASDHRYQTAQEMDYVLAFSKIFPASFQAAWMINHTLWQDNRYIPKVDELVSKGGRLEGTPLGTFLWEMIRCRPTDSSLELVSVGEWLKTDPSDPRALRFEAGDLKNLGRYDEAVSLYGKSNDIFPFGFGYYHNWEEQAAAMLKLRQFGEADRWVEKSAGVDAAPGQEKRLAAQRMVRVLLDEGEWERAGDRLGKALLLWPKDGDLKASLCWLKLKKGAYGEALAAGKDALATQPDNVDYAVLQLQAMDGKNDIEDARKMVWDWANDDELEKNVDFYVTGAKILGKGQMPEKLKKRETLKFCESAVREFPNSVEILKIYATALKNSQKPKEALKALWLARSIKNYDYSVTKEIDLLEK